MSKQHPGTGTKPKNQIPALRRAVDKAPKATPDAKQGPGRRPKLLEGPGAEFGLTAGQYEFCLQYLSNGFNATAAYRVAHPGCSSMAAASVGGHESLRNPKIGAYLKPRLAEHWQGLQMDGDEALARVAAHARVDVRKLYGENNELLPVHQWPDAIAGSVRSIKDGPYGKTITLVDPLSAQRIILEVSGKVRGAADPIDELTAALRATLEQNAQVARA
jgi:phage terminase small subunit